MIEIPPGLTLARVDAADAATLDAIKVFAARADAEGFRVGAGTVSDPQADDDFILLRDAAGELVACLVFYSLRGGLEAFISFAYVVPKWRRRGCYSAMWASLIDFCDRHTVEVICGITAATNEAMKACAHKAGRQLVGLVYEYRVKTPAPDPAPADPAMADSPIAAAGDARGTGP